MEDVEKIPGAWVLIPEKGVWEWVYLIDQVVVSFCCNDRRHWL